MALKVLAATRKGLFTLARNGARLIETVSMFDAACGTLVHAVALLAPDIELQARGLAFEDNRT